MAIMKKILGRYSYRVKQKLKRLPRSETKNSSYQENQSKKYEIPDCLRLVGKIFDVGVPRKGPQTLAGASPAMAKSQSHVAWMAGSDGNVAF